MSQKKKEIDKSNQSFKTLSVLRSLMGSGDPPPKKTEPLDDTQPLNRDSAFINPYTFVPISSKKPARSTEKNIGELTGVIQCTLEVKTPVFIPNTSKGFAYLHNNREHAFYDFFSYDDCMKHHSEHIPNDPPKYPRIPGSEIRGMVRNVYEQLTNACLSVIDEKNLPYKRTNLPKEPAIWDRNTNILYKAEKRRLNTTEPQLPGVYVHKAEYSTGQKVYVQSSVKYVKKISKTKEENTQEGYVIIGEKFTTKKYDSVFLFDSSHPSSIRKAPLTQKDQSRFQAVLDHYDGYEDYKNAYSKMETNRYLPVYYKMVGSELYLSPACITKEVFSNTIFDILKNHHSEHQPCDGTGEGWCPACRLFGMVGKSGKPAASIASRLRFSDSDPIENASFCEPTVLPVLGTPHYSATEFYLQVPTEMQPNGRYEEPLGIWNYDYFEIYRGKGSKPKQQAQYKARLQGRKVYWLGSLQLGTPAAQIRTEYSANSEDASYIQENQLKMRSALRPLKSGRTTFSVFFEDLTDEELSCLLFSLTLEKDALHRIGKGKPFGMGAVKIQVDSVRLRNYVWENGTLAVRSSPLDISNYPLPKEYAKAKKDILTWATPLSQKEKELVDYPRATNSPDIYEWFGNNRGSVSKPRIDQTLPALGQSKALKKTEKEKNQDQKNQDQKNQGRF